MKIFVSLIAASAATAVRKAAEWSVKEVATLSIAQDLPGAPGLSLLGTTFGPFGKDEVFLLAPLSAGQEAELKPISQELNWPNEAYQLSASVKNEAGLTGDLIAVANGFLFPGKSTGGIHLLNLTKDGSATPIPVTQDKSGWFYHHSEFLDVNGDGLLDVVAARATKPILGKTDTEFVWVENKGNGNWGDTKVIVKGPGVGFRLVDVNNDGRIEIVATEFFVKQQLSIFSCQQQNWAECAAESSVTETVLDVGEGPFFQPEWVDLNGDGRRDILATAQQFKNGSSLVPGKVLAFECPENWQAGQQWTRHLLADGYLPQPKQPSGSGSPGAPFPFDMGEGGKPHVVLSGDDWGVVDLLSPSSQDPSDWSYSKETLYSSQGKTLQGLSTVGSVLVVDIDASGKPELFIPSYAENKLLMYSFDAAPVEV